MGFSKFEFRPIKAFQYIGGFWFGQCRSSKRGTLFWTVGVVRMQILVLRWNLY